jgi:FkbH-like protein
LIPELAEVTNAFPAIQCRRFPEDPNDVAALLSELADLYGKPFDSAEDTLRLESLRAGAEIEEKLGSESLEEVLAGAEGALAITRLADPPDPRALELVNKTNQFNLNGRRFSAAEWLDYLKAPDHCAWIASYGDCFGPLGKIAVAAGRFNGDGELHLDAWVLSCRAFGRRIEYAMLGALFERHGLKKIRFEAVPTERNGPLREMLNAVTGCDAAPGVSLDCSGFSARKQPWYMRVEYAYE